MHIVITGASSGIGAALAREFGNSPNHRLTLVARRKERLDNLADELVATTRVEAVDLSELPLETGWLEEAIAQQGPIDILINNAGLQIVGPTAEIDAAQGEKSLAVNIATPLRLIRQVLPAMQSRRSGHIVNIASMAALAPTPGMTYYNASKAGLAAASEALRGELLGAGVNVLTVYPGIIGETEMATDATKKYESSRLLSLQPNGTARGLATEIAGAINKNTARVIYPRVNTLARWLPAPTRWLMDRFTPSLR